MAFATPGSSAYFTSKRRVATILSVPSEMSRADSTRICRQMPTWMFLGLQRSATVWSLSNPRSSGKSGTGCTGTPE